MLALLRSILLFVILLIQSAESFKYLSVIPRLGVSHTKYQTKLVDALVEAGHEVVILSAQYDTTLPNWTDKARYINVPQSPMNAEFQHFLYNTGGLVTAMWQAENTIMTKEQWEPMVLAAVEQCNDTFAVPGLIEQLKAEKFDAAFAETLDYCAFAIFHVLGIDKFAVALPFSSLESQFHLSNALTMPSYVPSLISDSFGESMSFFERLTNTYYSFVLYDIPRRLYSEHYDAFLPTIHEGIPKISDLVSSASLLFLNSDPLADFPRPTSHKIIDIGGIAISHGRKPLNKTWSDVLSIRPRNVLISFGTFAESHQMPENFKATIIETIKKFPDVTFIWKYEKPEHKISAGVPNLVESTFFPQNDLLGDDRISAFLTHAGQGSFCEANHAGVPVVVVPIVSDQGRNAQQMVRNGMAVILEKAKLRAPGPLEAALREVLDNPKYRVNAKNMAAILKDRPFAPKELFVRNMEFLAKHGPLRQRDHYGAKLNFAQYFLIDIAAFILCFALAAISITFFSIRWILRKALGKFCKRKTKAD